MGIEIIRHALPGSWLLDALALDRGLGSAEV